MVTEASELQASVLWLLKPEFMGTEEFMVTEVTEPLVITNFGAWCCSHIFKFIHLFVHVVFHRDRVAIHSYFVPTVCTSRSASVPYYTLKKKVSVIGAFLSFKQDINY